MPLLIKNATIVNAEEIFSKPHDIFIEKGVIVKVAPVISDQSSQVIDARGKLVLPGLIDLHVHLRQPGREDEETIETGSRSGVKGGFTSIFCMPNTSPVIDNAMIVQAIINEAKRVGLVNVFPIGAITRGQKDEELTDMFELKKAGCLALSDDGRSVSNSQLMRHAMEYAKMVDILLIQHCEDPLLSNHGAMNEGTTSTLLGLKGIPGVAETIIVARDIELAYYLKTKIHFAHMSLKRSVELIRFAKSQGIPVTAEACPHHFTLTDDIVKSFDTNTKVNPPLRTKEDVQAIKEGLKDGTIDVITTDHAPHTQEEKELSYDQAPFGMIGLETALGLAVTELVTKKYLTWTALVDKMSKKPAQIAGLIHKGEIREGRDADITILNPDQEWVVKKEEFSSKSQNSPFIGRKLKGQVETTICGGKVVYQVSERGTESHVTGHT